MVCATIQVEGSGMENLYLEIVGFTVVSNVHLFLIRLGED